MKSPMIENADYIEDKKGYSELQVLSSAAGYYVGTTYTDEDGFTEPGSRDSGYYRTYEDAVAAANTLSHEALLDAANEAVALGED